ncbi:MAG: hypothetical protein HY885_14960 [Deltaproteobacteria bacterium]|nr:hypothetical protein [Deltaproteobacteria bacterium]
MKFLISFFLIVLAPLGCSPLNIYDSPYKIVTTPIDEISCPHSILEKNVNPASLELSKLENADNYLYHFRIGNTKGLGAITLSSNKNTIELNIYSTSKISAEDKNNFLNVVQLIQNQCEQFETSSEIKENWIWESAE